MINAISTACDERLELLESSCAACTSLLNELNEGDTTERVARLDCNHNAMTAMVQELRQDFGDMNSRVSGHDSDIAGHHQNLAMMSKVNDVVTDLHKDVQMCRASLSDVVQPTHLARHREEHTSAMALNKEELMKLLLGEREARTNLEEAVVAVGTETRRLKDKVAGLDKLSEELSGEVQFCTASIRRGPKPSNANRQSLDRYREILSLRESP